MSLMRRMRDITVASLNDRLEHTEDPVRLIDQYLIAQREQIRQSETLYQQAMNHAATLRKNYLEAEQLKDKREHQAMTALKAGEEQLAKLALQDKLMHEQKSAQYQQLYEQSKQSLLEWEQQLAQLKTDYEQVYNKRQYYIARMESARLQQQMNERMNHFGVNSLPRTFHKLEERIGDLELEARSLRDVRKWTEEALYEAGTTVKQTLERELDRLKSQLKQQGGVVQ